MGYRDEKASLRARVAELETDLAHKDELIARLEGGRADPERPDVARSTLLDAPLAVRLEQTLDHTIDVDGLEAIAAVLRERLGLAVSQVGRTVRGKLGTLEVDLTMAGGQTHIRLEGTYHDRRNSLFIVVPSAGLLASILAASLLALLGVASAPMLRGVALIGGVLAPLGLLKFVRRVMKREQANLAGTFEAVLALADKHAAQTRAGIRARVAAEDARESEAEIEAEGAASEDAAETSMG